MEYPIEVQARALLQLAGPLIAKARSAQYDISTDPAEDRKLHDLLDAIGRVELVADRRVVPFARSEAVERLRNLARVSESDMALECARIDAVWSELMASAMVLLAGKNATRSTLSRVSKGPLPSVVKHVRRGRPRDYCAEPVSYPEPPPRE